MKSYLPTGSRNGEYEWAIKRTIFYHHHVYELISTNEIFRSWGIVIINIEKSRCKSNIIIIIIIIENCACTLDKQVRQALKA